MNKYKFQNKISEAAYEDIESRKYKGQLARLFGRTKKQQRIAFIKEYHFNPFPYDYLTVDI